MERRRGDTGDERAGAAIRAADRSQGSVPHHDRTPAAGKLAAASAAKWRSRRCPTSINSSRMACCVRHRGNLGSVGIALVVREGAPKPDISTPEKLRKVLLDARKIVHSRPGDTPSGKFLIEVFQDLGVTEEMKPKVVYHNVVDGGTELIIRGDVDFGLYPASAMIPIKGVAVAGLLPREVQRVTVFSAGIMMDNPSPEPAMAFIRFLIDPAHQEPWKRACLSHRQETDRQTDRQTDLLRSRPRAGQFRRWRAATRHQRVYASLTRYGLWISRLNDDRWCSAPLSRIRRAALSFPADSARWSGGTCQQRDRERRPRQLSSSCDPASRQARQRPHR